MNERPVLAVLKLAVDLEETNSHTSVRTATRNSTTDMFRRTKVPVQTYWMSARSRWGHSIELPIRTILIVPLLTNHPNNNFHTFRMSLTPHSIQAIYSRSGEGSIRATLQVLSISTLAGQPGRFKIVLSDGEYYTTGLLSSQLIGRYGGCPFKQYQLVQLEEYMINAVQDKLFILVHQMSELSAPLPGGQIGNPQVFKSSGAAPVTPQAYTTSTPVAQLNAPQPIQNQAAHQMAYAPPAQQHQTVNKPTPQPPQTNPYSSMPSHSPFAAGMAQPNPAVALQNPYQGQTAGPVRYLQATEAIVPMNQLTIYTQKWTIKARVTAKSDMRTFRNAKGEGQLMSIELVDQQRAELRATFFGSAAMKFHPMLQVGTVYTFSKGSVKPANPRFNPKAQYELMFDEHSEILAVRDDTSIPTMKVSLVPISSIAQTEVGETVDVAGIALSVGDLVTVTVKSSGRDTLKKSITIADESGSSIELTIWGEKADRIGPEAKGSVILTKGCRVGDYNGRTLSTSGSSLVEVDPAHARTNELKSWWNLSGRSTQFASLSGGPGAAAAGGGAGGKGGPRETILSMRQEDVAGLTVANIGDFGQQRKTMNLHTVKATLTHIPVRDGNSLYYKSCPTEVDDGRGGRRLCQKKVEQQNDSFVCSEQHINRQANARFILSMRIQDPTGECLVRAFHDESRNILGIDASDLDQAPDPVAAQQLIVEQALFKTFIFKIRSKKEIHMDEERLNMIVASAAPISPAAEAHHMLTNVKSYLTRIGSY